MTGPAAVTIVLSEKERFELEARVRRRKIARADSMRAEIVLLSADGLNNCAIADEVGVSRMTVMTWRKRFAARRLDGLDDEPRCGAPRKIGDEKIAEVVTKTLEAMPADATHWSTRSMAKAAGEPKPFRWPVFPFRLCIASGTLSRWLRIAARLSSSRLILSSLKRCVTSSAFILTRRSALWCFASMKRAKSRR